MISTSTGWRGGKYVLVGEVITCLNFCWFKSDLCITMNGVSELMGESLFARGAFLAGPGMKLEHLSEILFFFGLFGSSGEP